jgi:hypothetical protein
MSRFRPSDIAEFAQALSEAVELDSIQFGRGLLQHTDAPYLAGLLCACRERPRGRRTAEKRDEIAPSHVRHGGTPNQPTINLAQTGLRVLRRKPGHVRSTPESGHRADISDWQVGADCVAKVAKQAL